MKVRPIAPLGARNIGGTALYPWHIGPDEWGLCLDDDEFAAAFMPAGLFDAVLDAARAALAVIDKARDEVSLPPGYVRGEGYGVLQPLYAAVRAYDAHRPTDPHNQSPNTQREQ